MKKIYWKIAAYLLVTRAVSAEIALSQSEQVSVTPLAASHSTVKVQFIPPTGWRYSDTKSLPERVHVMVVGKGSREYPPSINLGTEPFKGTLKEYLKIVKALNDAQGAEWKDLGTILTDAGEASLSQLDSKSEWGDVRMMHVILIRDGMVYILTAASLKEEFPRYYQDFFRSMRSLSFNCS
jgi:hypothetical protein